MSRSLSKLIALAALGTLTTLGLAQPALPAALHATGERAAQGLAAQCGSALAGAGVITGATSRRLIHFTFDDGPDREETPKLLDALDRAGHKATFFFSTSRFKGTERRNDFAPELALEVARRGHQLGSHGYDHRRMSGLREPEARFQIDTSEALFEKVFGQRTFLFRPPFGSRNAAVDARLAEGRYATVMWNLGMADWVAREPEKIALTFFRALERNEAERAERGGVVLLHDTHAWSVQAYGLIAEQLLARNCELLRAGQELYDVTDSLEPFAHPPSDGAYAARQAELRAELSGRCGDRPSGARGAVRPAFTNYR